MTRDDTSKAPSHATENYLKAIFELGGEGVGTQRLAEALRVSPASVSGMLKKLALAGLVDYEKYRGASLTPAGRAVALETLRHHRLIETYLAEALGYSWHEVHDEAERLEHVISEAFEERIAEILGHPAYDPHGDPIPRRDLSLPESPGRPLGEHELGQVLKITRVVAQDGEVLRYLADKGLTPGAVATLRAAEPTQGYLTLELQAESGKGGARVIVDEALARKIHARALEPAGE